MSVETATVGPARGVRKGSRNNSQTDRCMDGWMDRSHVLIPRAKAALDRVSEMDGEGERERLGRVGSETDRYQHVWKNQDGAVERR